MVVILSCTVVILLPTSIKDVTIPINVISIRTDDVLFDN